ncbi:hypothetical protein HK405_001849, partial [Cladochytrium tenue]
ARADTAAQGQGTSNRWSDVFSDAKYAQVAGAQAVAAATQDPALVSSPASSAAGAPQVLYQAKCVFDFSAGREDDLSLAVGYVADVEREDGDWLMGSVPTADSGSRRRGWFPRVFVEKIDANREAEEAAAAAAAEEMAARIVGVAEAVFDYCVEELAVTGRAWYVAQQLQARR